jgi:hypothetical protein
MLIDMDINKTLNNRRMSMALIGLTQEKFNTLLTTFTQILEESQLSKKRKRKIGGGRKGNIKEARQKLFFILFYLKNYPTYVYVPFCLLHLKQVPVIGLKRYCLY